MEAPLAVNVVELPAQIVAVPLTLIVGLANTCSVLVTGVEVPVLFAAINEMV